MMASRKTYLTEFCKQKTLPAPGFEPTTFLPDVLHLHLPYRLRPLSDWAPAGGQYSGGPNNGCYSHCFSHQQSNPESVTVPLWSPAELTISLSNFQVWAMKITCGLPNRKDNIRIFGFQVRVLTWSIFVQKYRVSDCLSLPKFSLLKSKTYRWKLFLISASSGRWACFNNVSR